MMTKGDEYPIHQTPEPIAYCGMDCNFYDRYFFNGYTPDGEDFFALAFGVYPHLNVADAHFSFIRDGAQHSLHASKILNMERMDLSVGPIAIEVVEPLQRLRLHIAGEGIEADLTFEGRAFPVEEPRFIHRIGPRSVMDYTRMTQNGRWSGWVTLDGERRDIAPGAFGTRDRSWGVRQIGAYDTQPTVPPTPLAFFWLWSPLNFDGFSVFFHLNADAQGRPWNTRAVLSTDGAGPHDMLHCDRPRMEVVWQDRLRHAARATLHADLAGRPMQIELTPLGRFQMRGIGYLGSGWPHGAYKGALAVERESFDLGVADPSEFII